MKRPTAELAAFPAYQRKQVILLRWAHEVWDHLWPWTSAGLRRQPALVIASLALALVVSLAWGAAALGQLSRMGLIAWWFGWSLFEVGVRRQCKPYVKEGPWWGATWRAANWMDLLCYVLFKNLLLGSVLYLALNALGLLAD
jgi:hypothetical protein